MIKETPSQRCRGWFNSTDSQSQHLTYEQNSKAEACALKVKIINLKNVKVHKITNTKKELKANIRFSKILIIGSQIFSLADSIGEMITV